MQTIKGSLTESVANSIIGFMVSFLGSFLIFPFWGMDVLRLDQNLGVVLSFHLLSIARSFVIRRWFNSSKAPVA